MGFRKKIPTLSLFSGAGGLDIGFHKAGFDIVGCVEIEKQYCDTLIENRNNGRYFNPKAEILCKDIKTFDARAYLDKGIECVIGGPPCQPFSAAGRRAGGAPGMLDDRGKLFESYCNVLSILKPKAFVFENVYGITGANNGDAWKEINSSFEALGYKVSAEIIDAADYGVAQHRERLFLVGSLTDRFVFPEPTHGPDSSSGKGLVSILEAIEDIQPEEDSPEAIGGLYGHLLPLVPEGLNYAFFTKEMGYPRPYFAWRSKFHDFLYKADRNKPSRTLKAQPGKFTGPFHWNNRHFTINELKRIQSFPDDYVITGTNTQIMAQIGNSVAPKLAEVLAVSVREQLIRPVKRQTYPLRKPGFQSTFRQRQREASEYYKTVAEREIERRFGKESEYITTGLTFKKHYFIGYKNRFQAEVCEDSSLISEKKGFVIGFEVSSQCIEKRIQIVVGELEKKVNFSILIHITGLEKYLITVDEVLVEASVSDYASIFEIWGVVQKELVDISQFYSLIDIYGHYANRGDTVKVFSEVKPLSDEIADHLPVVISFCGNSEHCGTFMSRKDFAEQLGIRLAEIDEYVAKMRELRFDVRTMLTHPTITTDDVICTYPFPMLSERVMFEKRIKSYAEKKL